MKSNLSLLSVLIVSFYCQASLACIGPRVQINDDTVITYDRLIDLDLGKTSGQYFTSDYIDQTLILTDSNNNYPYRLLVVEYINDDRRIATKYQVTDLTLNKSATFTLEYQKGSKGINPPAIPEPIDLAKFDGKVIGCGGSSN
ncbi:MAG: hypothetical protein QE271_10115 [Bacteriovoracaceae bacterium]|nr:hypothetical protein [Bacteriovoracaceae bacterium]